MNKSIAKSYDKLAYSYTKKHAYDEHLAISSLNKFLKLLPNKAKVLDIGCGGGQDAKYLSDNNCVVLGIDVSKEMIKLAKNYSPNSKFKVIDLMKLPSSLKYEGLWCCRVFHHISLSEQDKFIFKLKSLLKKNGILYITCAVSDKKVNYEAYDSGNDGLLKKRLTAKSFKELLLKYDLKILKFKYWDGKNHMEIFAKNI